ncbi:MAG: alpha/beta hydrolase [Nitriliruptorales bacterium]|nr:alpha/beta hydrolase [Nitriliruptorales bacterium]
MRTADLDGGRVDYQDTGSPDDPAVIVLDGMGSRLVGQLAAAHASASGVRIIAPDRPGYWDSSPREGSPLESWPQACRELLDHLGIEHAAVLGSSAACPMTFAAASALGARITAVAIVGPMAPFDETTDLSDMIASQRRAFRLAARRPALGAFSMRMTGAVARRSPNLALRLVASQRPRVDAQRIAQPELRHLMLQSIPGLIGPATPDDLAVLVGDWTHVLDGVVQPVRIWVGTDDSVHPRSMAVGLKERLASAEIVEVEGGFFACTDRLDEILTWATATD